VLERGGVEGHYVRNRCSREIVGQCRRRGPAACPLPSREELAATLAAVQAFEVEVHDSPVCAATLPALPAGSVDDAIAAGRDTAAALAGTTDPSFRPIARNIRGGAFKKFFVGVSVHGEAFWPLADAVRAMARPTRTVGYTADSGDPIVYGVVGSADGIAMGVLLSRCPSD
jgi:hypothetical protein